MECRYVLVRAINLLVINPKVNNVHHVPTQMCNELKAKRMIAIIQQKI